MPATPPEDPTPRPRRRSPATPEQMAAREADREARSATQERKARTRRLIQVGGVAASYGVLSPEQMAQIMEALTSRDSWRRWLLARGVDLEDEPSGP